MQILKLKALADRTRLNMINYLGDGGDKSCCQIAEHVKKDASTVFRHLEILKRAGIIKTRKDGQKLICSLKDKRKINIVLGLLKKW